MVGLEAFLTAYDPSDLPGGSIDLLGFEAGYLFLAEKLLPDLTNVASRPRYFSVLCTGIRFADAEASSTAREQYRRRLESVLRLERLWILANVLASRRSGNGQLPTLAIRGIRYAEARVAEVEQKGLRSVTHQYRLLSRQAPYGLVGIYAAVAERLRMIERKTLTLTQDLGEPLAEAFVRETKMPKAVERAVREGAKVPVETLASWGERSHVSGRPGTKEKACLYDAAFNRNPTRFRMLSLLRAHPSAGEQETELARMRRIVKAIEREETNRDLLETMRFILEYENCYRLALLGLERLLWLCRVLPAGSITPKDLGEDAVLGTVADRLPRAYARFRKAMDSGKSHQDEISKLDNVNTFLAAAADACNDHLALAHVILDRHRDVQGGKFDRGRRKMPWIQAQDGRITLTVGQSGGQKKEMRLPEELEPHYYRFAAGDQLVKAACGP